MVLKTFGYFLIRKNVFETLEWPGTEIKKSVKKILTNGLINLTDVERNILLQVCTFVVMKAGPSLEQEVVKALETLHTNPAAYETADR